MNLFLKNKIATFLSALMVIHYFLRNSSIVYPTFFNFIPLVQRLYSNSRCFNKKNFLDLQTRIRQHLLNLNQIFVHSNIS